MITITGQYQSTGGRKANAYSVVSTAAIAIGVDILKDRLHFVAIDLYGEIIQKKTLIVRFFAEEEADRAFAIFRRREAEERRQAWFVLRS